MFSELRKTYCKVCAPAPCKWCGLYRCKKCSKTKKNYIVCPFCGKVNCKNCK